MAAFDRAELSRFGNYNKARFIIEVQAILHYWYHIGRPYDRVPNLIFEPLNPPRFAKSIFNFAQDLHGDGFIAPGARYPSEFRYLSMVAPWWRSHSIDCTAFHYTLPAIPLEFTKYLIRTSLIDLAVCDISFTIN